MCNLPLMFQMDFTVWLHGDLKDQNDQKWEKTGHLVLGVGHRILILGLGFSYALDFQIRAFVSLFHGLSLRGGKGRMLPLLVLPAVRDHWCFPGLIYSPESQRYHGPDLLVGLTFLVKLFSPVLWLVDQEPPLWRWAKGASPQHLQWWKHPGLYNKWVVLLEKSVVLQELLRKLIKNYNL